MMKRFIALTLVVLIGMVLGLAQPSSAQDGTSRFGSKLVIGGKDYGDVAVRNGLEREVKAFLNGLKGADVKSNVNDVVPFKPVYTDMDTTLTTNPGDQGQRLLKYVQGLLRLRALKEEFALRGASKNDQRRLLRQWQELRQAEATTPHEQSFDWYAEAFRKKYADWVAAQTGPVDASTKAKAAPKKESFGDDEPAAPKKGDDEDVEGAAGQLATSSLYLGGFRSVRNLANQASTLATANLTGPANATHGGADASDEVVGNW